MGTPLTRWEQFYHDDPRIAEAPPSRSAHLAAEVFASEGATRILEIGCGAGRDTALLASQGCSVIGVDAAATGLAIARRRVGRVVPLLRTDARRLPLRAASFDGMYCFGLLHEFTGPAADADVSRVMHEIRRVLRPGGMLVLAVLAGEPEAGLPHLRLFSADLLDAALAGFVEQERRLVDDIGCTGRAGYGVWWVRARREQH